MKKRILLSLVSFFTMTAMWASLVDAYQIYVTAGAGKTGASAELTLNMKNKLAINTWTCTVVLPAGVTYEAVNLVPARYPEGFNETITAVANEDGSEVTITVSGTPGVDITGTDGAVATVTVAIASDVEPGDYAVTVKNTLLIESNENTHEDLKKTREFTWTIEKGEEPGIPGDLTGDGKVDIADAVSVLDLMASGEYSQAADLTGDGKVDIADFVSILDLMAQQ